MNVIEIHHFTKQYKHILACDDISLSVPQGSIYGFVGKNGAGKSTLIRAMTNMIFPTSGTIKILGFDCIGDSKELKKHLSYMPSEMNFTENIKVQDIFRLSSSFSGNVANMEHLCKYFELDWNKSVNQLSLGNKKKVLIINAFLKDSDVYILDEPTNGLDPLMQEKFFKLLLEKKKEGKTIFLSSHNLSEIEKYADIVAIIKNGKIVEEVTLSKLSKNKRLVTYELEDGTTTSFIHEGNITQLLNDLLPLHFVNLEIKPTSIEEEFRSYYED